MSRIDLKSGAQSSSAATNGETGAGDGSRYAQPYSTAEKNGGDCSVLGMKNGIIEVKVHVGRVERERVERDCRICHLSLESSNHLQSGIAIELGCSCKDDLGAAHKKCAETWFNIKGNKTCEICKSVACNVFGTNETNIATTNDHLSVPVSPPSTEPRSCFNGHRVVNFLLACIVFTFVISWLFHFNIPIPS